jgi:hypothetical protein
MGDDRASRDYVCMNDKLMHVEMQCARYDATTNDDGWGGFGCVGEHCCSAIPRQPIASTIAAPITVHGEGLTPSDITSQSKTNLQLELQPSETVVRLEFVFEDTSQEENLLSPSSFRRLCEIENNIRAFQDPVTGTSWTNYVTAVFFLYAAWKILYAA